MTTQRILRESCFILVGTLLLLCVFSVSVQVLGPTLWALLLTSVVYLLYCIIATKGIPHERAAQHPNS